MPNNLESPNKLNSYIKSKKENEIGKNTVKEIIVPRFSQCSLSTLRCLKKIKKENVRIWSIGRKDNGYPAFYSFIADKKIDLVINIPKNIEKEELDNDYLIRRKAVDFDIPLITNMQLAKRFVESISKVSTDNIKVKSWDEYN